MRRLVWGLGFILAGQCGAQTSPSPAPDRVQAIVQVKRDNVGADIVKVSMIDPHYPLVKLQQQIDRLGSIVGGGARGLQIIDDPIDPRDPTSQMLRATFAVNGLIGPRSEWVKVAPIVKAFAGTSSSPGLNNFQVDFDYQTPTDLDLGDFASSELSIRRRTVDRSVEYQIQVKNRGTHEAEIPDLATTITPQQKLEPKRLDLLTLVVAGVAIVAAGSLVYCLFLLKAPRRRSFR